MTVLYLTDRDVVGGGTEYIRLLRAGMPEVKSHVLYSGKGECWAHLVNQWKADVIHVSHLRALLQLYSNPFVRPNAPVVFTVHGVHLQKYDFLPRTRINRLRRFLRWSVESYLYKCVSSLIVLTDSDGELVRRLYGGGVPIHVVPNGGIFDRVPRMRNPNALYEYISIARFCLQKGQRVLVKAVAMAQDALRHRGARVLMVGSGEDFLAIKQLVEDLHVSDLIDLAGEIPQASRMLSQARALVVPSLWEGSPFLLLEAASLGLPVIASACNGHVELIRHGETGLLFPTNDSTALSEILKAGGDERYPIMGQAFQREMRESYSLERMVGRTRNIYQGLSLPENTWRRVKWRERRCCTIG